ncbi:MAG: LuxR C-terminal-related transcriptional regulator [Solirubrobacterales bacterium]
MNVAQAAGEVLAADASKRGITESLSLFCEHLEVDRISLHSIDQTGDCFRVVTSAGWAFLADGTELPLEISSQVLGPSRGGLFRNRNFQGDEAFDRPLDLLVKDMGYQSGCSIPLFMGSQPVGILCASSHRPNFNPDPVLDAMNEASLAITQALNQAEASNARVMICVDDDLLAQGIARVIEKTALVDVETFSSTQELQESGRAGQPCQVVVCDVIFDGIPVGNFLASLRSGGTNSPALVLATKDSPMSRSLARQGGAAAYVARSAGVDRFAATIRHLIAGDAVGSPLPLDADISEEPEMPQLTGQEGKILVLLERGLRFKQIALELRISESTAKGYARNLFAKLGAHSRSEAVYIARNRGLLDFIEDMA